MASPSPERGRAPGESGHDDPDRPPQVRGNRVSRPPPSRSRPASQGAAAFRASCARQLQQFNPEKTKKGAPVSRGPSVLTTVVLRADRSELPQVAVGPPSERRLAAGRERAVADEDVARLAERRVD